MNSNNKKCVCVCVDPKDMLQTVQSKLILLCSTKTKSDNQKPECKSVLSLPYSQCWQPFCSTIRTKDDNLDCNLIADLRTQDIQDWRRWHTHVMTFELCHQIVCVSSNLFRAWRQSINFTDWMSMWIKNPRILYISFVWKARFQGYSRKCKSFEILFEIMILDIKLHSNFKYQSKSDWLIWKRDTKLFNQKNQSKITMIRINRTFCVIVTSALCVVLPIRVVHFLFFLAPAVVVFVLLVSDQLDTPIDRCPSIYVCVCTLIIFNRGFDWFLK